MGDQGGKVPQRIRSDGDRDPQLFRFHAAERRHSYGDPVPFGVFYGPRGDHLADGRGDQQRGHGGNRRIAHHFVCDEHRHKDTEVQDGQKVHHTPISFSVRQAEQKEQRSHAQTFARIQTARAYLYFIEIVFYVAGVGRQIN